MDSTQKLVRCRHRDVRCVFWDTFGNTTPASFPLVTLRKSVVVMVLLDTTKKGGLAAAEKWVSMVRENSSEHMIKVLIATKVDADYYNRVIDRSDAEIFAVDNDYHYFEVSSKTGHNARGMLETVCETFIDKLENDIAF